MSHAVSQKRYSSPLSVLHIVSDNNHDARPKSIAVRCLWCDCHRCGRDSVTWDSEARDTAVRMEVCNYLFDIIDTMSSMIDLFVCI